MQKSVDAFLSVQSPYSYFAAPRLMRLDAHPDVKVHLRLVMPAVLRIPDVYADRSVIEQEYFLLDVKRTAAFLGLDYAEADPYPVEFEPQSLWRAASEQPRIYGLLDVLTLASEAGKGLTLFDAVMRRVWGGQAKDWHLGHHLRDAAREVGINWDILAAQAAGETARLRKSLLANNEALLAAGHWGVPCFVFEGEPFYGQDRFGQLVWRMGLKPQDLTESADEAKFRGWF